MALQILSPPAISDDSEEAKVIGGDQEKRIIATYEGIQRGASGLPDVFLINLENVSDKTYELYIEIEQFNRGALVLIDPSTYFIDPETLQQREPIWLASIFNEADFSRDHDRQPPSELVKLQPGQSIKHNLRFSDYINFDVLANIEKVDVYMTASLQMYDENADYKIHYPVGRVSISNRVPGLLLRETP